jgi:hypothetical protein
MAGAPRPPSRPSPTQPSVPRRYCDRCSHLWHSDGLCEECQTIGGYRHCRRGLLAADMDALITDAIADQPPPTAGSGRPIWELVIADMHERDRVGRARYGTPLQAGNGRDALVDAYQEALDMVAYLRQAIEERLAPALPALDRRRRRV